MKLGFVESLKNVGEKSAKYDWKKFMRSAGKRHTVIDNPNVLKKGNNTEKRTTYQDYFNKFTKNVLPQFEENIEIDYLQKQFKNIQNEQIKNDLIQAYIKRRIKLHSIDGEELEELQQQKQQLQEIQEETYNPLSQNPLNELTEKDIGMYVQYPISDLEKYFKDGKFFGDYTDTEVYWTKKFALMANEESLKIVEYLKRIKLTQPELQKSTLKIEDNYLENDDAYFLIYRQFSIDLLEAFQKHRSNTMLERYLATPNVFDFIIRITIDQIQKSEQFKTDLQDSKQRKLIFENIVNQVIEKGDPEQCNSQYLVEFMATMKELTFTLSDNSTISVDLLDKELMKNKRQLPEFFQFFQGFTGINSGAMLYGDRGTGKSGTLGFVTMWAHKNDFVVVNVPSAYELTNSQTIIHRHQKTGLYLQNDLAKSWLEYFAHGNSDLLEKIAINKNLYGKFNYSGIHDEDPVAVPNTYYKRRKAYFEDHKQFLYEEEIKLTEELDKKMEIRVSEKLPEPKTLKELVQYGIENEWFACNVVYEVLEQLYNLESHCVLVVVDEFNYLYKESVYPSFRYANDKELDSHIPPYHLSLCRAFVNMDGHKIKNGFKLAASSVKRMQRHKFTPEKINLPMGYSIEMEGLPLDDFRNMCQYYLQSGLWNTDEQGKKSVDYLWMQTQGNWGQAQKYMIEHYVDSYLMR